MHDRMFKDDEREFWLYPKLLLVGLLCIALIALMNHWLPGSWASAIGFVPLLVVMIYAGRPLSYRKWLIRIVRALLVMAVVGTLVSIVKRIFGL